MKLFIVRHAEADHNASDLVHSASDDSVLTATGRQQAQQLAQKLSDEKIDFAYVSPLQRAKQTAEIVLAYHPEAKVEFFSQLIERSFGKYHGQPKSLWHRDWQASGLPYTQFKPEGGETWSEAGQRVADFIQNEIIAKHQSGNDTILVVGHGSTLMHFLMTMDGRSDEAGNSKETYDFYHPHNTAVSIIEISPIGESKLLSLNDISHLGQPPTD
jgi:probable phosphoglycerate mutase